MRPVRVSGWPFENTAVWYSRHSTLELLATTCGRWV